MTYKASALKSYRATPSPLSAWASERPPMRYTKPKTAIKNDSPDIIKDTLELVFNLWATPNIRMRAKIMFEDPYN